MDIPQALRALRKEKGWSQRQAGDALHKTEKAWWRWENGHRQPSREILEKLAMMSEGKLSERFAESAGLPRGYRLGVFRDLAGPEPLVKLPEALYRVTPAQARVLNAMIYASAELIASGSEASFDILKHYADELLERAGSLPRFQKSRPSKQSPGKKQMTPTFQFIPSDEEWFRKLAGILSSQDLSAIENTKTALDAYYERVRKTAAKEQA